MRKRRRRRAEEEAAVVRAGEPPEGDPFGAEAELDRGVIKLREVAAALDAGALEQIEELRRWREHTEREGREKIPVGAGGYLDDRIRRRSGVVCVERRDPCRYRSGRDAGARCGAAMRAKDGEQGAGEGAGMETAGVGPDARTTSFAPAGGILSAVSQDPGRVLQQGRGKLGDVL
jgi:hypothetical protein